MKKAKVILICSLITTVAAGLIMSLTSLVISKTGNLPDSTAPLIITIICAVSAFIGGLILSSCLKEKGAVLGLICSSVFAFLISGISLAMTYNPFTVVGVIRIAAILIGGVAGGIVGVNKRSKVKF